MIPLKRLPKRVTDFLYRYKSHFRCGQGQHYRIVCWLLVALILDAGKGKLIQLSRMVPRSLRYWALLRMVRAGWWDEQALIREVAGDVLLWLPPPADGTLYVIGDSTVKGKRGRKHPLGFKTRMNEHAPYIFGFAMVLLVAARGRYRVPVRLALVDPRRKGHANILFRQMLRDFIPPAWARQVVVLADAGMAAKATLRLLRRKQYGYIFALPRTWKLADGTHLRNLVRHLAKHLYKRCKSSKPDGRRKSYWVFRRRAELKVLGQVTIILSKERRNFGPKKVKIIVTNLTDLSTASVLSGYARRWDVELTIKELKGALHLGQMQVTRDKNRVQRSVALSVLAYLLLLRLYGKAVPPAWSIFQLKQRFTAEVFEEHWNHSEQRWQEKLDQHRRAA